MLALLRAAGRRGLRMARPAAAPILHRLQMRFRTAVDESGVAVRTAAVEQALAKLSERFDAGAADGRRLDTESARRLESIDFAVAGVARRLDAIGRAEAVLVPASAVAPDGTRLGRGGGSYDRALRRCTPGTPRIALLFDDELVAELPRDDWDEPVTAAVRPLGWTDVGETATA